MCRKNKDGTIKRCHAHTKAAIEAKHKRYTKGLLNAAEGIVPFQPSITLALACQAVPERLQLDAKLANINALDGQLKPLRIAWAKAIQLPITTSYEDPIFSESLVGEDLSTILDLVDSFYLAAYYDDIKRMVAAQEDSIQSTLTERIAEQGWQDYHELFSHKVVNHEEPVFGAALRKGYETRFPGMIENIRIRRLTVKRNAMMQELVEDRKTYDIETSMLKYEAYDPKKLADFEKEVYSQQPKIRELLEEITTLESEFSLRYQSKVIVS